MRITHELKIMPEYFEPVIERKKTFEIRFNDRNYQVGDWLLLKEIDKNCKFTGRRCSARIRYIYDGNIGLLDGFVILGIEYEANWTIMEDMFKQEDL